VNATDVKWPGESSGYRAFLQRDRQASGLRSQVRITLQKRKELSQHSLQQL